MPPTCFGGTFDAVRQHKKLADERVIIRAEFDSGHYAVQTAPFSPGGKRLAAAFFRNDNVSDIEMIGIWNWNTP